MRAFATSRNRCNGVGRLLRPNSGNALQTAEGHRRDE